MSTVNVTASTMNTIRDVVNSLVEELARSGMKVNNIAMNGDLNMTVGQMVNEGRTISIIVGNKKTSHGTVQGSCHRCKTRRGIVFVCRGDPRHKLCEKCASHLRSGGRCPICVRVCDCAQCRRERGGQKKEMDDSVPGEDKPKSG